MIDIREYLADILEKPNGEEVITAIVGALSTIASDPKVIAQGIDITDEINIIVFNPNGNIVRKAISRAIRKLCAYDAQDDPTILIDKDGFDMIETKQQNCLYLIHDDSEASLINVNSLGQPIAANQTNIAPITATRFRSLGELMLSDTRPMYKYRLTVGPRFQIDDIPSSFLRGANNLEELHYFKINGVINNFAFAECRFLKEVVIGSAVRSISSTAFYECERLRKITIRQAEDSIPGAPWGAPSTTEVIWTPIE